MLCNIVDRRTNHYNVMCSAIFEPSYHFNHDEGATQFVKDENSIVFEELAETTVKEAIVFANTLKGEITMFLYDSRSLF